MDRLLAIRDDLLSAVRPVAAEDVPLAGSLGRYLAADALARVEAPPHTCSAMDGYAVRAADVAGPCALAVAQTIYAGDVPTRPLGPHEAARIFTGATLPEGADAVVREEATRVEGRRVELLGAARVGENVRRAGEDVARGALALAAGTRIGARQVGGAPARSAVPDRVEDVRAALEAALAVADAVVTVGGVSVGERDHVPEALAAIGAEVRVHGVPMKPGKPFLFALARGKPVLGLPGSPSACLVAFEVFARPALLALAGAARCERTAIPVRLSEAVEGRPGRARLLWARLEPGGAARPLGKDSAQIRGPALADALLLVPAGTGNLPAGAVVTAWLLEEDAPLDPVAAPPRAG